MHALCSRSEVPTASQMRPWLARQLPAQRPCAQRLQTQRPQTQRPQTQRPQTQRQRTAHQDAAYASYYAFLNNMHTVDKEDVRSLLNDTVDVDYIDNCLLMVKPEYRAERFPPWLQLATPCIGRRATTTPTRGDACWARAPRGRRTDLQAAWA